MYYYYWGHYFYVSYGRWDHHFRRSSEPHKGLFFMTLSFGQVHGIEPVTSRSTVKLSTDWANPAAVKKSKNIAKKFVKIL